MITYHCFVFVWFCERACLINKARCLFRSIWARCLSDNSTSVISSFSALLQDAGSPLKKLKKKKIIITHTHTHTHTHSHTHTHTHTHTRTSVLYNSLKRFIVDSCVNCFEINKDLFSFFCVLQMFLYSYSPIWLNNPSWGGPIELFLVPASAPRLV